MIINVHMIASKSVHIWFKPLSFEYLKQIERLNNLTIVYKNNKCVLQVILA